LTDVGVNDKFLKDTAVAIQPGTAAPFVLVRKLTADKVLAPVNLPLFQGMRLGVSGYRSVHLA
jgi:uncharacterized membrane protein